MNYSKHPKEQKKISYRVCENTDCTNKIKDIPEYSTYKICF